MRISRPLGRPRIGREPAVVLPVRLARDLNAAVKQRATAERTTVSELVRSAVVEYLTGPANHLSADQAAEAWGEGRGACAESRSRGRAQVVPVRFPSELKEQLESRAKAESTSVSEVVRAALRVVGLRGGTGSG